MNVYFCDVCGVRVTDVDLHSGHGMRRRNDVICAACLDLGKGKDWGAQHAHQAQKATAMAGAGAANSSSSVGPSGIGSNPTPRPSFPSHPVDIARDRVRTMDEDIPQQPVSPVVLPSAPFPPDAHETPDDTAQVAVMDQELSSAAAGFAALTPSKRPTHEDDEDLEETPVPKLDESGAQAVQPMSPFDAKQATADARADTDGDEDGGVRVGDALGRGNKDDDALSDGEKSETAVSDHIEASDKPQNDSSSRKREGSSRSTAKGRPGSSSKVSKASKAARSRKSKGNSQQMMLLSGMSLLVVLVFGIGLIVKTTGHSNAGVPKGFEDVSASIKTSVADAKSAARSALGTHDLAKLTSARVKLQDMRAASQRFEKVAKEHGWDDDQVSQAMTTYGVYDTQSLDRNLRDEIEITKAQQH